MIQTVKYLVYKNRVFNLYDNYLKNKKNKFINIERSTYIQKIKSLINGFVFNSLNIQEINQL